MNNADLNVVTGAFGYTGKYIARKLLANGHKVRTLTGHPERTSPFGNQVKAYPLYFDDPDTLTLNLRGASTLYNTYWIRFPRGPITFDTAVENTKTLINAAAQAGVQRIVHISITNPSASSPLGYFKGKALVEEAIMASGLAYSIIRPTLIFGAEDVLINNIAWFLRKFPIFLVPGDGNYSVQPVHVKDVAELAVGAAERGENTGKNTIQDCIGPEVYTYEQLIRLIAASVGSKAKVTHLPPALALFFSRMAGYAVRDVVLTKAEIDGLMAGLLVSDGPPNGQARFSRWLEENGETLGRSYASEMNRHYR
ncbi:MAG: NmrA family NAD(P)-binding protein [SAR202 cluster bacterium]|nr:NmrA family NAD(P)-binding protein [SAR202 cluster bacterium]